MTIYAHNPNNTMILHITDFHDPDTPPPIPYVVVDLDGKALLLEFEKCVTRTITDGHCVFKCKLGLWGLCGPYNQDLVSDAFLYFQQYKAGGEYSSLIGGPTVEDVVSGESE